MSKKSRRLRNNPPPITIPNRQPVSDKRSVVRESSSLVTNKEEFYSGPIPPPEILEKFEALVPGAADRIISMAENQSAHRQSIEKTYVESNVKNFPRGQRFGFILGLAGIASGTFLTYIGQSIIGVVWFIISIGSLIGAYIHGAKRSSQEAPHPPSDE